jgi:hypothetical protein
MDSAKVHPAKMVSSPIPELRLKRTLQPAYSAGICLFDFFVFDWRKGKLQQQQFTDPDRLFEAVDEISNSLRLI